MTPFLQLRLWLRRAAVSERLTVAGMGVLVVALAVWAAVPVGSHSQQSSLEPTGLEPGTAVSGTPGAASGPTKAVGRPGGAAAPGTTGGATPRTTGAPLPVVGPTPPASTLGAGSGSPTTAANPCAPTGAPDQGVTTTKLQIDVTLADLQGQAGNALVGIPSAEVQKQMFEAAIADVNKRGGVKCRAIVAKYYKVNPLDQSSLEAVCLDIVADKPFALLDVGLSSPVGSPAPRDCPPQHKIPSFGSASLGQGELSKFSPYLFSYYPAAEKTVHNAVLGAHQLGWFTGATKVGLIEQQCNPNLNVIARRDLKSFGFSGSKLSAFDFGCGNGIPAPQDVAAAVLQFQRDGVTHVFDDSGVYENFFSQTASKQGYKPKYATGDQGTIALWNNPTFGPEPNNFDGGLVITGTRYGEEHTAGMKRSALTTRCDAAMKAKGLQGSWESPNGFSGVACADVFMFADAANASTGLRRDQLAASLRGIGRSDLPYPAGPSDFVATKGQTGGGFWRAATYRKGCSCFQITRAVFTPDFL